MSITFGKNFFSDRINPYLICLLLGIVAATFFSRIWDPDFFWHLATGRWIVQNQTMPDRDPFTPFFYGTEREALILKGYWLAQVCYQFFYALFGPFGLALLKSATFVTIFGIVLHCHRIKKTPYPWVFLLLLPLYETLLQFRADRPNMFSLLFFAGLLYLLETRRWKLLPLLMLAWANAHGGYLLGDVVILLYLGALALNQRQEVSPQVAGWALLAVGASFINPLGITPVVLMLKFEGSVYQQAVYEFLSPVRIALEFHDYYPGYYLVLLLAAGALPLCRKSSFWPQLAVLLLTAYISLRHARYMPFFVISCAFFLPVLFSSRITLTALWGRCLLYGATALIIILFMTDIIAGEALSSGYEPRLFPEKAAAFVERSGVTGRVFCNDVWGGYLLWRLPEMVILNDGRALSEEVYLKNLQIKNAKNNWENELRTLDAQLIIFSTFNPFTGKENKLWQPLIYSQNWQLIYADDVALVYVRKDVSYVGQRMTQEEKRTASLHQALTQKLAFIQKDSQIAWHWGDLGQIHVLRGEIPEAVKAYRQALTLDAANDEYRVKLKLLEAR